MDGCQSTLRHQSPSKIKSKHETWRIVLNLTLPETNSKLAPENWWLVQMSFLLGPGLFSGAFAVSFREGKSQFLSLLNWNLGNCSPPCLILSLVGTFSPNGGLQFLFGAGRAVFGSCQIGWPHPDVSMIWFPSKKCTPKQAENHTFQKEKHLWNLYF